MTDSALHARRDRCVASDRDRGPRGPRRRRGETTPGRHGCNALRLGKVRAQSGLGEPRHNRRRERGDACEHARRIARRRIVIALARRAFIDDVAGPEIENSLTHAEVGADRECDLLARRAARRDHVAGRRQDAQKQREQCEHYPRAPASGLPDTNVPSHRGIMHEPGARRPVTACRATMRSVSDFTVCALDARRRRGYLTYQLNAVP
ncbi:MAG: hypothetical protein FD124_3252 [Alphaproteobacteria bacterium]|nr:MAG: hypothetical protein FD160_1600 [Caulobacteraceae bacterium]TPW02798.1 MAG: hypothetical protein FD124_3252 [Alphaproteobacteria bacterium]